MDFKLKGEEIKSATVYLFDVGVNIILACVRAKDPGIFDNGVTIWQSMENTTLSPVWREESATLLEGVSTHSCVV
jgi:hypothetical protein